MQATARAVPQTRAPDDARKSPSQSVISGLYHAVKPGQPMTLIRVWRVERAVVGDSIEVHAERGDWRPFVDADTFP